MGQSSQINRGKQTVNIVRRLDKFIFKLHCMFQSNNQNTQCHIYQNKYNSLVSVIYLLADVAFDKWGRTEHHTPQHRVN